jgi:hypothetical protein
MSLKLVDEISSYFVTTFVWWICIECKKTLNSMDWFKDIGDQKSGADFRYKVQATIHLIHHLDQAEAF